MGSFKNLLIDAKYRLGLMSKEEVVRTLLPQREDFIERLPAEARPSIRNLVYSLDQLSTVSDVNNFFALTRKLSGELEHVLNRYGSQLDEQTKSDLAYISGSDALGYRPSGARAFNWFMTPFAPFTFFSEQHWATKAAIEIILTEVIHDGYSLVHDKNMSKAKIKYYEDMLKFYNIFDLRLTMLQNFLVYGNVLILPHKNFLRNTNFLEVMVMDRMMPVYDRCTEKLIGWDYWYGYTSLFYSSDRLLHLKTKCLKNPEIGLPPISPLVIDLEADLAASSLNSTSMHKMGCIGTLIALEDPNEKNNLNQRGTEKLVRRLQKEIHQQFSGIKGGHSILVSNYIKQVHKISQMGDFEASFMKFRTEVAKAVCTILKVPPEKISINRSSGLQYQAALVEDSINASFDKAIAAYMTIIDNFINEQILKGMLGIDDLAITANGRYGSLTLNGARALLTASQTGPLFDMNEGRTIFYGLPPLPPDDPRSYQVLDNSKNRDEKSTPIQYTKDAPESLKKKAREEAEIGNKDDADEKETTDEGTGDSEEDTDVEE